MFPPLRRVATLLLIAIAGLGCGDSTLTSFEPEITNVPDNFQLQATKVRAVSTTLIYKWQNTGTQAKVNHATTTTMGSAQIVIRDAAGVQVYAHDLVPTLDEVSAPGTPGYWTIRVVLSRYSGTLNVRVQKQ